jgi:hypothetical protein
MLILNFTVIQKQNDPIPLEKKKSRYRIPPKLLGNNDVHLRTV